MFLVSGSNSVNIYGPVVREERSASILIPTIWCAYASEFCVVWLDVARGVEEARGMLERVVESLLCRLLRIAGEEIFQSSSVAQQIRAREERSTRQRSGRRPVHPRPLRAVLLRMTASRKQNKLQQ